MTHNLIRVKPVLIEQTKHVCLQYQRLFAMESFTTLNLTATFHSLKLRDGALVQILLHGKIAKDGKILSINIY